MQGQAKKAPEVLKVKFRSGEKTKIKVISYKELSYGQFASKLIASFELEGKQIYKLYYFDGEKEEIIVNSQEDFEVFLANEALVLYLDEAAESDFDFRRFVDRGSQRQAEQRRSLALQAQVEQVSRELEQKDKKCNQWMKEVKSLRQALEKKEEQLRLKNTSDLSSKSQKNREYTKIIEQERERMIRQLKDFQLELQKKTGEKMKKAMESITKDLLGAVDYEHKAVCENTEGKCEGKKRIKGLRYYCIVCRIELCKSCSLSKIKSKAFQHSAMHPMVQYRDESWDSKITIQLKEKGPERGKGSPEKPRPRAKSEQELMQKIKALAQLLQKPEEEVTELVVKNRKYPLDQLVELYFSTHSNP